MEVNTVASVGKAVAAALGAQWEATVGSDEKVPEPTSASAISHRNKSSHAVTLSSDRTRSLNSSKTGGPVGQFANPMQRRPL